MNTYSFRLPGSPRLLLAKRLAFALALSLACEASFSQSVVRPQGDLETLVAAVVARNPAVRAAAAYACGANSDLGTARWQRYPWASRTVPPQNFGDFTASLKQRARADSGDLASVGDGQITDWVDRHSSVRRAQYELEAVNAQIKVKEAERRSQLYAKALHTAPSHGVKEGIGAHFGDELRVNQSLEKSGDVSRSDILRLQRQVAEVEAQIQAEMTNAQEGLSTQTEQWRDRNQNLEHTELSSPLDGIVKNLKVTTFGDVVHPGDIVLEFLPTDSDLIAEANIGSADIAFIKLDAYDYTNFCAMTGEVSRSADTFIEKTRNGLRPYCRVQVPIKGREFHSTNWQASQLRAGMAAGVEIKCHGLNHPVLPHKALLQNPVPVPGLALKRNHNSKQRCLLPQKQGALPCVILTFTSTV
jgi:multidrug efflux pump subunit AcrA (membrane-fusion protein)